MFNFEMVNPENLSKSSYFDIDSHESILNPKQAGEGGFSPSWFFLNNF